MTQDAYLVAVTDEQGVSTGYYRCSLCNAELSEDSLKPDELAISFAVHVGHVHGSRQKPIESIEEASARVVAEAVRMIPKKP
jgi:hypothetical protein